MSPKSLQDSRQDVSWDRLEDAPSIQSGHERHRPVLEFIQIGCSMLGYLCGSGPLFQVKLVQVKPPMQLSASLWPSTGHSSPELVRSTSAKL